MTILNKDGTLNCCLHDSPRTFDWCEHNCERYYQCDTVAWALDAEKERENNCQPGTPEGICSPVHYVSVWDGGVEVETTAKVDIRTGEVTHIAQAAVNGLEICEREYIVMNGEQVDVFRDEHGFEYWADIEDEIGVQPGPDTVTTQCVNGALHAGDLVISTPDDDYACLVGRVLQINLLGSPEHDAETENDTDDVHVDFTVSAYSDRRIAEIEEMFSCLYEQNKEFEDCPIDDTIMAPDSLIRITGIDSKLLEYLLDSGFNAACYCYNTLLKQQAPPVPDMPVSTGAQPDIEERVFNVIDTALANAGFKVMDGGRDYVIIRHSASDTDFEIKLQELPG